MKLQHTQQTDYDTCLACCLLMLRSYLYPNQKIDKNLGKQLYVHAFGQYHTAHFSLKYAKAMISIFKDVSITIWIHNLQFSNHLKKISRKEKNITVKHSRIDIHFIHAFLKKNTPVILMTDMLHINHDVHDTHYVVIAEKTKRYFRILDPAQKDIRYITHEQLTHAIHGLTYQLLWSPVAITMKKIVKSKSF